jgi:hypothetical protein
VLPAAILTVATALATGTLHPLAAAAIVGLVGSGAALAFGGGRAEVGRLQAVGLVAGLVAHYGPRQSPTLLAAGFATVVICLLPLWIWPLRKSSVLPLPHMFGLLVAAYVIVGTLFARSGDSLVPLLTDAGRVRGLFLTAAFVLVVVLGTVLGSRGPRKGPKAAAGRVDSVDRLVAVTAGGYLALFFISSLGLRASLGAIPVVIDSLRLMGIVGLFGAYLRGMVPARWLVGVFTLVVVEMIAGLGSGAIYTAARPPLAMLILFVCVRRRIPWLVVVLSVLAALMLNTTKGEFRTDRGRGDQTAVAGGLGYLRRVSDSSTSTSDATLSRAAARFSYSTSDLMGYVEENAPDRYPFLGMTTYRNLPLTVVPRVLYPEKPNFNFGNQFGRRFGLLGQADLNTAENLPLSVEAYAAFGAPGLLLIGLAIGLLFATICRRFSDGTFASAVIGTVIISALIRGVESDSTLVIGTLPLLFLVVPPVLGWASRGH